jgi:hypothetical protein
MHAESRRIQISSHCVDGELATLGRRHTLGSEPSAHSRRPTVLGEPGNIKHINYRAVVDIASLLTASSVGVIVGSLITRGTARSSSRTERTDEYRREVRSAASLIVGATRSFIDAAMAFERSIYWVKGAVQTTSGHDETYIACQETIVDLAEKIANFEFLVDIDILSKTAHMIYRYVGLTDIAVCGINIASRLPNYTEAEFKVDLKEIREQTLSLEKTALPEFRECVKKYVPHTIVEEKRWRKSIVRALTVPWHRLML